MARTVTPAELKERLRGDKELALVDLRERGVFYQRHLLLAACIPLSRLELEFADLVPRRGTPIVLVDDGPADGVELAATAAQRLEGFGYTDVAILEGGTAGWEAAGYEVFSGVNVPSKAFGEFVEQTYGTPHMSADEVKARLDAGDNMVILDSRPYDEYHEMNIPTGIDMPGAELAYRVHDAAPDPETLVVVNCAGRTRSIIGAQSLINAGISNPVTALENGTMGWHLAGHQVERGAERRAPEPSADGLAKARAAAARVAERFGVRTIDRVTVEQWRADADSRTLFVLDVRSPEEFRAGHLAATRSAPGGQLVQATDEYMVTRGARVVLVDDTGVRATMTASWLIQLGWDEVYVLDGGLGDGLLVEGDAPPTLLGFEPAETLSPRELQAALDSGEPMAVVDLATSREYRKRHIPRAWWAVRARFANGLFRIPRAGLVVLTSPDGTLAHLALEDAEAARPGVVFRVLDGGTDAWIAAGLPTDSGLDYVASEVDDVWYRPYEHKDSVENWMRAYLTWEVALVEQIERDGDAEFRVFD